MEGSDLTFDIPFIFRDMDYDLVIRHEHLPNFPNPWEKATVTLIHLDGPPEGRCAPSADNSTNPEAPETSTAAAVPGVLYSESRDFRMDPGTRSTVIEPGFCLEKGKRYQAQFKFDQYDPANPNSKASILIDAVILKFLTISC